VSIAKAIFNEARDMQARVREDRGANINDWLGDHLKISRGSGPAPYNPDLTPYWKHWLNIAQARISGQPLDHDPHAHLVESIYNVCANQLGKTQGLVQPLVGWTAAVRPRSMGMVLQRNEDLRKAQTTRLQPMFELTPRLRELLPGGQTEVERRLGVKVWKLSTCDLHWMVGNSAQDLRSYDLPLVALDEFDAFPIDCQGEGNPIALVEDRQKGFPHSRFILGVTTPTTVSNHGWSRLCRGTHERLHVACPHCGAHHWLQPDCLMALEKCTDPDAIENEDLGRWKCPTCSTPLTTQEIRQAVHLACVVPWYSESGGWLAGIWTADDQHKAGGSWRPVVEYDRQHQINPDHVAPLRARNRSGHMNSLYSAFITLSRYVSKRIEAHGAGESDREAFVNGWDGDPYIASAGGIDQEAVENVQLPATPEGLTYRHSECPVVPWRVLATLDQQGIDPLRSWFPYVVRAWLQSGESYLVEAGHVNGFDACDQLLEREWVMGGQPRGIDLSAMDSANGPMQKFIRQWCAKQPQRRLSIAGSGTMAPDNPWSEIKSSPQNRAKLAGLKRVWFFNAHSHRDYLSAAMQAAPQAWFIPPDAPEFYTESLTSEERVQEMVSTRGRRQLRMIWRPREWEDEKGTMHVRTDNHWFDCEVQQMAVVNIRGWFDTTQHQRRSGIIGRVGGAA
jgi:phage terminase large subunit GpA-like protein